MSGQTQRITEQPVSKQFRLDPASDIHHAEASPGAHQKLIRQTDGRYFLIVRETSGFIRRLPVMVFEGGFLSC